MSLEAQPVSRDYTEQVEAVEIYVKERPGLRMCQHLYVFNYLPKVRVLNLVEAHEYPNLRFQENNLDLNRNSNLGHKDL